MVKLKPLLHLKKKKKFYNSFTDDELKQIELHKIEKKIRHSIYRMCIEEVDCGTVHKIVTYETATRNEDWKKRIDTPYEMMVKKYGLANISNRFSTMRIERKANSFSYEEFRDKIL